MVYLDAASTAKYRNIDDIIVDTMATAMRDSWQNPSSLYATDVKKEIDKLKKQEERKDSFFQVQSLHR